MSLITTAHLNAFHFLFDNTELQNALCRDKAVNHNRIIPLKVFTLKCIAGFCVLFTIFTYVVKCILILCSLLCCFFVCALYK